MKSGMHRTINAAVAVVALHSINATDAIADSDTAAVTDDSFIALAFSDGSESAYGIRAVNERLMAIGVRVSRVDIPEQAKPILRQSAHRALSQQESDDLIQRFQLGRCELLDEIRKAGREPEMHRGGHLQTSEPGVPAYPKVYDMKSLDHETTLFLQRKFGKLHVNSSEAGVGIDEVMTIVSGGPYTWFFVFADKVVGKLRLGKVHEDGRAWRISYPGLVPHGGYFDAPNGLVVAYAHGPKRFTMRYEDPSVEGYETLGSNPWIDFSKAEPELLDHSHPVDKAVGLRSPSGSRMHPASAALEAPGVETGTAAVHSR